MSRVFKLTARIESLRADESAIKTKHAEAMVALADDDFGDIDSRAIKKLADQLQAIRVEIAGLEDALEKAAALDEADRAREADQKRLVEFQQFEASLQPRLEAVQRFEDALQLLVATIREVQVADAGMPVGMLRKTPWQFALVHALAGVIGRDGVLPRAGDGPQPIGFWDRRDDSPCSSFVKREHQYRAFNEATELHRDALLDDEPTKPEHMRESIEPTKPKAANRPTFNGTFAQMPDGYYLRECDARVFKKTEHGFEVAVGHPGYNRRTTMTTREIG